MTTRRIKVLIVSDEMEVGGTQRQIVHLARHIDRTRFDITVAYFLNPSFLVDELQAAGVRVVCVPKKRSIDPMFVWKLRRLVREGFDVIHCVSFTGELWGAVARNLAGRTPLITSVRSTYGWYSRLQWMLKRWASRSSRLVVANSRTGAEYALTHMGIGPEAIRVVYNGFEESNGVPKAGDIRQQLGLSPETVVGLYLGRLVEQKNVPFLMRACSRIAAEAGNFTLLLAGDGPLRGEIEQLVSTLGLDSRVKLLGRREDVRHLLHVCDFLVHPSLWEGLSNSILEAMAAARPVLASDVGGNGELVVDGVTGLLYPVADEARLMKGLSTLIADAETRRRMGEAGLARVRREFGMATMVATMEDIYAECAGDRGASPR